MRSGPPCSFGINMESLTFVSEQIKLKDLGEEHVGVIKIILPRNDYSPIVSKYDADGNYNQILFTWRLPWLALILVCWKHSAFNYSQSDIHRFINHMKSKP